MAKNNRKYTFGVKNVNAHKITETDGAITYSNPIPLRGCTKLTLDTKTENTNIYADDTTYDTLWQSGAGEGSLELYEIPDEFKIAYQGFKRASDGALVKVDKASREPFALTFDRTTKTGTKRFLVYSVYAGDTTEEAETKEETTSPNPYTVPLIINKIRIDGEDTAYATYDDEDEGFATVHTAPQVPTFTEE